MCGDDSSSLSTSRKRALLYFFAECLLLERSSWHLRELPVIVSHQRPLLFQTPPPTRTSPVAISPSGCTLRPAFSPLPLSIFLLSKTMHAPNFALSNLYIRLVLSPCSLCSKRKSGILKKAKELAVLTGSQVRVANLQQPLLMPMMSTMSCDSSFRPFCCR